MEVAVQQQAGIVAPRFLQHLLELVLIQCSSVKFTTRITNDMTHTVQAHMIEHTVSLDVRRNDSSRDKKALHFPTILGAPSVHTETSFFQ